MDLDKVRSFLRHNGRAVVATLRDDGGVQMSPVLTVLDDDGALIISSREPTAKVRNLRKRPYAYVTVLNEGFYGNWVEVEGAVTIESLPGAMEGLIRYYRLAAGEHPDWDDYRKAMERDQRVLIRMQIERASGVLEP